MGIDNLYANIFRRTLKKRLLKTIKFEYLFVAFSATFLMYGYFSIKGFCTKRLWQARSFFPICAIKAYQKNNFANALTGLPFLDKRFCMREGQFTAILFAACALFAAGCACDKGVNSAEILKYDAFNPGKVWLDNNGRHINAHRGRGDFRRRKILYFRRT